MPERGDGAHHPETVRKVLSALVKATYYIHQHSDKSQNIVARHLAAPRQDWNADDFSVQLDSFLARALTAHAVVMQGGRQAVPDFQHSFYYQGLQSVLPSAAISTLWEKSTE